MLENQDDLKDRIDHQRQIRVERDRTFDEVVELHLESLISAAKQAKPDERSERARRYQILITQLETAQSWFRDRIKF